jgi:DNA polymerase-1
MMVKSKFIAPKGKTLATFDYNQMELRILASCSNDPVLLDAFKNNVDVHQITADALKIPRNPDAKIVNFSIVYGTTEFGLSEQLGCSVPEAKEMIKHWLDKYVGVRTYMSKQKALVCKTNGWVYSYPAGLPIYCGEFLGADRWEEDSINRRAINAPIQGGSQDILKKAIINIKQKLGLAFTLMVHDELVYEIDEDGHEYVMEEIKEIMQNAWMLPVPLIVSSNASKTWEK